jgi:Putative transmembrane protein (PGPGW)
LALEQRSPSIRKHLRVCGGFLALFAGIIMAVPLVPGPGIPLIIVGLVLLGDHFVWAKRILNRAKQKWQEFHAR